MSDYEPMMDSGVESDPNGNLNADNPDSLANPFLAKIPEADRNVVARYIKDWDAGVTKKFQDIHAQYRPYKEFGEPDQIRQAMSVYQLLENDPRQVYDFIGRELGLTPQQAAAVMNGQGQPGAQEMQLPPEYEGLPQPFVSKFQQMEQLISAMAQQLIQSNQQQTAEQEDAQLDAYMGSLKSKYGEFDEEYVLSKMSAGASGDDAVNAYFRFVQESAQRARRPSPPVLSGNGSAPSGGIDPTKLSGQDTKKLVAQMLQAGME